MVPALGVTEPGAIAFCVAKAKSYTKGRLVHINVAMNSGMYKNAFTCGIPNSSEVGNLFAAVLGYILESSKFINSEMFVEKKANIFVFREYIIRNFSYELYIDRDSVM